MATYYFRNVTGDWGTAANWSTTSNGGATGVVPLQSDDAIFDGFSGTCSVSSSNRVCRTLDFTNYTNTITVATGIGVSGSITLGSSMGISGAGFLAISASGTITTNGKHWPNDFRFVSQATPFTVILADDLVVSGSTAFTGTATNQTRISSSASPIRNIRTFGLQMTSSATTGSANGAGIVLCGTGTWTGSGAVRCDLTINTPGTLTIGGTVNKTGGLAAAGGQNFTYTAGTVVTTNSRVVLNAGAPTGTPNPITIISMSGFNPVNFDTLALTTPASAVTNFYLDSNINTTTFTSSAASTYNFYTCPSNVEIRTSNFNLLNSICNSSSLNRVKLVFAGTGNWSSGGGFHGIDTDFSSSGTTTITTNIFVAHIGSQLASSPVPTMCYLRGNVSHPHPFLLSTANTVYNTAGMNWGHVSMSVPIGGLVNQTGFTGYATILSSSMYVSGNLGFTPAGGITFNIVGNPIFASQSLTLVTAGVNTINSLTGSNGGKIVMCGTGTWSQTNAPVTFPLPLEIDTPQTVTISGSVNKNGDLIYTRGTVVSTDSTLVWGAWGTITNASRTAINTITANNPGLNFNIISCSAYSVFTGSNGFDVNQFRIDGTGTSATPIFTVWGGGNTYNILQRLDSRDDFQTGVIVNRYLFTGTNNVVFQASIAANATMSVTGFTNGNGRLKAGDFIYAYGVTSSIQILTTGSHQGGVGASYTVTPNPGLISSRTFIASGSGLPRPFITLANGALQFMERTNAVDVDSSLGQTIIVPPAQTQNWGPEATNYFLWNATNWNPLSPSGNKTVGYTWVS